MSNTPISGQTSAEQQKAERIRIEQRRLGRIYSKIEKRKKDTVQGLIQRAAYMRVTLEDFEEDLDTNGYTELFQQGEKQSPYDRQRPVAQLYQNMNNSYQKIVKQLTDLLPKEEVKTDDDDGFMNFVAGRKDG